MYRILFVACAAILVLVVPGHAQDVFVAPASVIFEDGDRGGQLHVGNTGDLTSTYTLEPTFYRMERNGTLVEVAAPFPENSAVELVRFSPRQFQLQPGTSQVVRIAPRVPDSLPPGEYRVHLRITNTGAAQMEPEINTAEDGTTTVEIKIHVARAVRVIVRNGVTAGRASVSEVSARRTGGRLIVTSELARTGSGSSKGSYRVYTRDGSGNVRDELAHRGVLIYSELPQRIVEDTVPASAIRGGVEICVAYRDETAGDGGEEERCVRPG